MRIALTGASSGIGSVVAEHLSTTEHVAIRSPRSSELDLLGSLDAIAAWISDAKPDVLLHFAGAKPPQAASALFALNPGMTFGVLEGLRRAAPRCRFILASSASVYGSPIGAYGVSKLLAEKTAEEFHLRYGLPIVVGRIFNAIATPGDRVSMLPQTAERVRDAGPGEALPVRDPYFTRDFIHVRDVAGAFVALAEAPDPPRMLDVGTGVGTSVLAVAQMLVDSAGKPVTLIPEAASGMHETSIADVRALLAIGWRPRHSLEEAVRSVWEGPDSGRHTP